MTSALLERLLKSTTIKETDILSESKFFHKKDMIQTAIPIINVALSGSLDGGFIPGLTLWAGPSKHFKTLFSMIMVKAYMDKYPDAIVLLYDSEFGSPLSYFTSLDIDMSRIIHTPIVDVEQLKFDVTKQLNEIKHGDKVIILVDSIGNLASKKEADDAMNQNSASDMSRAKQIKSLFRIVTPHLTMKDIPMVCIMHTYKTQEMYSKDVVSGGCMIAGSKVLLATGDYKNIEEFQVGDIVETLSGPKPVTHVWNPNTLEDGNTECYEVTFDDGFSITVSPKHKFLVDGQWIEAQNLESGIDCEIYHH